MAICALVPQHNQGICKGLPLKQEVRINLQMTHIAICMKPAYSYWFHQGHWPKERILSLYYTRNQAEELFRIGKGGGKGDYEKKSVNADLL